MSLKFGGNAKGERDACVRELDVVCRLSEAACCAKEPDTKQFAAADDFSLMGAIEAARRGDAAAIEETLAVSNLNAVDVTYAHHDGVSYHIPIPKLTSPRSVIVLLRNGASFADLEAPPLKEAHHAAASTPAMSASPTSSCVAPACAEQDFVQRYNLLSELRRQYQQICTLLPTADICNYLVAMYQKSDKPKATSSPAGVRTPTPPEKRGDGRDKIQEARIKYMKDKIEADANQIERRKAKEKGALRRRELLEEFSQVRSTRRRGKQQFYHEKREANLEKLRCAKEARDEEIFSRMRSSEAHHEATSERRRNKLLTRAALKKRREIEAQLFLNEESRNRDAAGKQHTLQEAGREKRREHYRCEVLDPKQKEESARKKEMRERAALRAVGNEALRKMNILEKRLQTEHRLNDFNDQLASCTTEKQNAYEELEEIRSIKKECVVSQMRLNADAMQERYNEKVNRSQECLNRMNAQRDACQQQALYRLSVKEAKVSRMKQQQEYQRLLTLNRINEKKQKLQAVQDEREQSRRLHQLRLAYERMQRDQVCTLIHYTFPPTMLPF